MGPALLEIIVTSVADAVAAERGGATRLEVISRFDVGGLTPPLDLVREIRSRVTLPLRVMLRETEAFEVRDEGERRRLGRLAGDIAALGVEGLVIGFLRAGEPDMELLRAILSRAPGLQATFHRAIEEVREPLSAVERLKELPAIDCLLTSGGVADWAGKVDFLSTLREQAAPEMALLIGGGLDLHSVEFLLHSTSFRAFHLGKAVRIPAAAGGAVCAAKVNEFAQLIQWKT